MDTGLEQVLRDYNEQKRDMRYYEHAAWHAVNVKRHGDCIPDIPALLADIHCPDEYRGELVTMARELAEYDTAYEMWIEDARDQLRYELAELQEITKGGPDEHGDLRFIRALGNVPFLGGKITNYVYFLGRSEGWACFQDIGETIIDDFNPDDPDHTPEEITEFVTELRACMAEVEFVKNYISGMNAAYKWAAEVHHRAEEYARELVERWENTIDARAAILAMM